MSALRGLVMVMCVLLAVCAAGVSGSEDRVKLCGRELIRRAVMACGNSRRFRRNVSELGAGSGSSDLDFMGGVSTEEGLVTQATTTTPELPTPTQSTTTTTTRAPLQLDGEAGARQLDDAGEADDGAGELFLGLARHWYHAAAASSSSRARRAASRPDVCCEKGCSMQELIQFC